ncbi:glycosyltransferase family 2 protein [Rosenbergiella collisarenosi]|uniref:glycosyltransferase family 2 protein n=1 Tax=Rosenbergiella collisarenosi TaxID=1544695 RepID=UPI001F4D86DB|nr:glycosyltransferase family 2 protein [Rosenbergiella collisarenosi]
MLNIVIPMAGEGSRFKQAGYKDPKPLIEINNKHMIEIVINNLTPKREHRFIFICQERHLLETSLERKLKKIDENSIVISLKNVTRGAAETVLQAEKFINSDSPLMIANCDQWIDKRIDEYLTELDSRECDGMIMSMTADDEKWSYLKLDSQGRVVGVKEKQVISNEASVGIYNFKRGKSFCTAANKMINENNLSAGEFYVAPVYNYLIHEQDAIVEYYNIGKEFSGMYGLGIPSDLDKFLKSDIHLKATNF